ncbi:MAG TPA: zf-HC2 domain-containing protein [Ktedonobacteraceae bacterium]|nr:zf-HC2 domain-containing protein [Ktedonobacteraceae bacterium]
MAQENQHLTTEQLSALLDGEVSAEEKTQYEAHLATCQRCQQELASLRRTVALLRALPQPALPRSFELPLEVAEPVALFAGTRQAAAPIPLRAPDRRRQDRSYLRFAFRTLSTIAAMIGIVFVLSGIVPTLTRGGTTNSAASTSASSSSAASSGQVPAATPKGGTHPPAVMTPSIRPAATPAASQVNRPTEHATTSDGTGNQPSTGDWPTVLFFNLSTPEGRLGLGILLFILGMMGYILFRRKRARAP